MAERIVADSCSNCKYPLDVGPIYATKDISICGRCDLDQCTLPEKDKLARQYLYEKYVGIQTFICKNKSFGCDGELNLDAARRHKYICRYTQIMCPFRYMKTCGFSAGDCAWSGSRTELNFHVKKWHHERILKQPVLSGCNGNKLFFTHVEGHLFTVVVLNPANYVYIIGVFCIGTPTDLQLFKYEIKLFNEQKTDFVSLRRNSVESIFEISEHLNSQRNMVSIDLRNFKTLLGNLKQFTAIIGIKKKNKKEIRNLTDGSDSLLLTPEKNDKVIPLRKDLLWEMKCFSCREIMSPPVHMCSGGHSICDDCHHKLTKCPTCQKNIKNARNFAVENLMHKIEYPCRNNEAGCFFTTSCDKIQEHEAICEYRK